MADLMNMGYIILFMLLPKALSQRGPLVNTYDAIILSFCTDHVCDPFQNIFVTNLLKFFAFD